MSPYHHHHRKESRQIEQSLAILKTRCAVLTDASTQLADTIAAEKEHLEQLQAEDRAAHEALLLEKERELRVLQENEPGTDEHDEKRKRQQYPHRVPSPIEQDIERIKGGALPRFLLFLLCLVAPGYGMIKAVQIRQLRQQAHREWEKQISSMERAIRAAERSLRVPSPNEEQRKLQRSIASREREARHLSEQITRIQIELDMLPPLLEEAKRREEEQESEQAKRDEQRVVTQELYRQLAVVRLEEALARREQHRIARVSQAKRKKEEEQARRVIVQAQIDEALERKAAARLMHELLQAQADRRMGSQDAADPGSVESVPHPVVISEVPLLEEASTHDPPRD